MEMELSCKLLEPTGTSQNLFSSNKTKQRLSWSMITAFQNIMSTCNVNVGTSNAKGVEQCYQLLSQLKSINKPNIHLYHSNVCCDIKKLRSILKVSNFVGSSKRLCAFSAFTVQLLTWLRRIGRETHAFQFTRSHSHAHTPHFVFLTQRNDLDPPTKLHRYFFFGNSGNQMGTPVQ